MKKLSLILIGVLCCVPLISLSETIQVGELYYEINHDNFQATVIRNDAYKTLTTIDIPSTVIFDQQTYSVTSIGYCAFSDYYDLTSITIPDGITCIEDYAFCWCLGLTSVTIPESVTSIGIGAFDGVICVAYNGSATGAPWGALIMNGYVDGNLVFENEAKTQLIGCSRTTTGEIVIPNSVTSIEHSAFYTCRYLTSITIPERVTSIGEYAFGNCSGLTSIAIPVSVTSIGDYAFSGCSAITSITIPESVTNIGEGVFSGCFNLTSVCVENGNETYDSRDNSNAIIETSSNTLIAGCKNTTIPESITTIGDAAFSNCFGLTSITIPDGVTEIGDWAFVGCSDLTSITIPENVTSIGDCAFLSCSGLISITCLSSFPPKLGINIFVEVDLSIPIQVPCAGLEAYQTADEWSSFENFRPLTPTFAVQSSNPEWGYVQTEGEVESCGDMITISAIPMSGYSFVGWSDGNTDNPRTLELMQNIVLTAEFEAMDINTSFDAATYDNADKPNAQKTLRNGQVLILRDGKAYNLLGQELR